MIPIGSATDVAEIDTLKLYTGQATTIFTSTPLAHIYLALFTATPSDAGGGTEVTGGGYARVDTKGLWATPAAGSVSNNATITFPTGTGAWSSGAAITSFALFDAVTGGNMLVWGTLADQTKTIGNSDTMTINSGGCVLTMD